MNKRNLVLQTAIVGIFASSSAFAAVNITGTVTPAPFAQEIIATVAAPVTLLNPANGLDIVTNLGYSFSSGEVRYVRMELNNGAKFTTAAVTASTADCTVGAVNGVGTSVIYFSVTAATGACTTDKTLTVAGTRTVTSNADVNVAYSMYDQPSQAQFGGSTGRIVNDETNTYIDFTASYTVAVTAGSAVADVSATGGAYTEFYTDATHTNVTKPISSIDYKLAGVVNKINGTAIALSDLMATGATGTKLTITGDFSAANNVFLATDSTCSSVLAIGADDITATSATFNVGATATTDNKILCYEANGTDQIAASDYTGALTTVSAAPTVYAVTDINAGTVGTITRNGTELQTPWFSTYGNGYTNRFVLQNTGTTNVTYTTTVRSEADNAITAGSAATGTIAAGKVVVIPAADVATFSGNTRGAVSFTINSAPSKIKGTFQQVNPTSGNVTNVPMERVYSTSQF